MPIMLATSDKDMSSRLMRLVVDEAKHLLQYPPDHSHEDL